MEYIPESSPEFTRRTILRAGLIGAGCLAVAGIAAYNFAPKPSSEQYPKRSMEYSPEPTWQQDFKFMDRTTLDTNVWRYDIAHEVPGYNNESQAYTDWYDNVRIEPGTGLIIEALRRQYQYPDDPSGKTYEITSGRIDTLHSFSFEYGKVEARLKVPEGAGVWPAFWLLSGNEIHTESGRPSETERASERFPAYNGEIDIMEYYGNNPGVIEATVHTFEASSAQTIHLSAAATEFHTYGVEVAPESITWTLDGEPYHYFEKVSDEPERWPFGQGNRLYVILNLAMGGPAGDVQPDRQSWQLLAEHVRYHPYTGQ